MRVRVIKNLTDHAFKIGAEVECIELKPDWRCGGGYFIAGNIEDIDSDTFYVDDYTDSDWKGRVSLKWAMRPDEYEVIEA